MVLGSLDLYKSTTGPSHPNMWWGVGVHLVGHEVGQQHDVAPVDAHAVVRHGVLDLVDDGGAGRLDAQGLLHLGAQRDHH